MPGPTRKTQAPVLACGPYQAHYGTARCPDLLCPRCAHPQREPGTPLAYVVASVDGRTGRMRGTTHTSPLTLPEALAEARTCATSRDRAEGIKYVPCAVIPVEELDGKGDGYA